MYIHIYVHLLFEVYTYMHTYIIYKSFYMCLPDVTAAVGAADGESLGG